ncbi:MAG: right-handed parallel beta-helix repeat-containing protein [Thermoplasmata archaeon]
MGNNKKAAFAVLLLVSTIGTIILLLSTMGVKATTITVDDDGVADYIRIQDAIDASSPSDTVYVYNGTYYEHIIINKTINLTGENQTATVLDGNGTGTVILISANSVNVRGFAIQNSGSGGNSPDFDAGIGIASSDNRLDFNTIMDCTRCICLSSGSNNNIAYNTLSGTSSGIYLGRFSSNNNIAFNTITNCNAGVWGTSSSNNNIANNTITGCTAWGIILVGPNNNVTSNIIVMNAIKDGTGITLGDSGNNVTYNTVTNGNRAICLHSSSNNNITTNTIIGNYFGIMHEESYTNNNVVASNTVVNCRGEGISLSGSNNNVNSNIVTSNQRGIRLSGDNNIIASNIVKNSTQAGICMSGTMNNITSNMVMNNTRGIYLSGTTNNIASNTVMNNTWGIYLSYSSSNDIKYNTITNNTWCAVYLSESNDNIINSNDISNNGQHGLYLYSGIGNTAINNWWGSATGPSNNTTNPGGRGDKITGDVPFSPWMVSPFNFTQPPIMSKNHAPTITNVIANRTTVNAGENVNIIATATDADGDVLIYSYFATGGTISGNDSSVLWTAPANNGTYTISVTVRDGNFTVIDSVNITVDTPTLPTNHAPTITSITANRTIVDASEQVAINVNANDTDNDDLTCSYATTGGAISGTGPSSIIWIAPTTNGTYTITVTVSDGTLVARTSVDITVVNTTLPSTNNQPTVSIISQFSGKVNGMMSIIGTASDDASIQYVQVSIDNAGWTNATGTTSWNYLLDTTKFVDGKHSIKVRAYGGAQYSDEKSLEIDVKNTKELEQNKGFLQGFEISILFLALGISVFVVRIVKKR